MWFLLLMQADAGIASSKMATVALLSNAKVNQPELSLQKETRTEIL